MAMAEDSTRTPLFAEAIRRRLHGTRDHVVVDIGTGPFCLLALMAAQAGARRVYAIEANPVAAASARASLEIAEAEGLVPTGVVSVLVYPGSKEARFRSLRSLSLNPLVPSVPFFSFLLLSFLSAFFSSHPASLSRRSAFTETERML